MRRGAGRRRRPPRASSPGRAGGGGGGGRRGPRPGPGEVLIRLEAVSLCGTDLHIYRWDEWARGRLGKYLPRIFGHEMAGRVVAHGPGTGAVPLGTRVAAETHLV